MEDKKTIEISKAKFTVFLILLLVIMAGIIFYVANNEDNTEKAGITNSSNVASKVEVENTAKVPAKVENVADENIASKEQAEENDHFVLYKGYKIALDTSVQDLSDMKLNEENKKIYNTKYYNYENGRYVGESEGELVETYDGYATVDGVKRIAISEKYNAIPRTYTTIVELPKELEDMADYTDVKINSIDLDGDGKTEYILCYKIDYAQGDIGDGEPQASSGIMLFDSNYKKIADLVSLEDGFGVGPKTEENKVFLSIDDVEYIDIDKDGIIEIIIDVPVYEGDKISIVKYNNGKLEGQTDVKATLGA